MRRALRVLIPAALLGFLGLGVVAFTGELNLLRVDFASLLHWDTPAKDLEGTVVAATPSAETSRAAPAGRIGTSPASAPERPAEIGTLHLDVTSSAPRREPPRKGSKIDFARISAEGTSVIGGSAPAGSRVSLHAGGKVIAVVTASEDGQWSAIVTRPFSPGPLALSVSTDAPGEAGALSPILSVDVPKGSGRVELAAAAPKPRPILPSRDTPPAAEGRAISEFAAMVERARSNTAQGGTAKAETPIVPVPIRFVTGEASMTPGGAQAAQLLAEYVRIMKPHAVTLSGHADIRGSDDYNLDLSRRRLETIRAFLRANGYNGELSLLAKGKSEPYQGIDRTAIPLEEVYQADRRVELRLAK
ncbi:MAG: OmpA family protein [Hyphomicrobiaceae bacterium]